MYDILSSFAFWGHFAAAAAYIALAVWLVHQYRGKNWPQVLLIGAMAMTAVWGFAATFVAPFSLAAQLSETVRNLAWLGFMFSLLRNSKGQQQRSINMIYAALTFVLLSQPVFDLLTRSIATETPGAAYALETSILLRMIFGAGALVLVHNLYSVSAPETRWGISLPMAALAAMWTFDLNLYTISYLTSEISAELINTRGIAMALLAPVFVIASKRNSQWRLQLSRTVAFQSVSLLVIGAYLIAMVLLATAIEMIGGTYVRLAQVTLIIGMSVAALLILPSGPFKAWLNVMLVKNFFQHRYDYRSEWMRFADTIGFPSPDAAPFYERVIKSLADIFESPGGLIFVPDDEGRLTLQARWNWSTAQIPANCVTSHTMPFFESTGHILAMNEIRAGKDDRCDPRAVPQWLYEDDQAWAVVPLVHFGKLAGLAVLSRPRLPRALDWEDLDMLRIVGRQVASYLAEASSQQALADNRQFEQFNRRFAFVMHDIKNLVSQLSILARNAEKHANKPEFQVDMVDTLRSSVDKMNELLARLSQHNTAKHNVPLPIDISDVVMKSVYNSRLVYPIETQLTPGMLAIADAARVDTIIGHIVQNAIEASAEGAPVKITSRPQGANVAISIIDTGTGMTESFIANQLFKPFVSTKPDGFGIGAYEARALAVSMGGSLRVESRIGKGTNFTLLLPAATQNSTTNHDQEAA
ncbi:XrtA/PEP-CTERM system histidine kinase PrsK [Sphingorhabdus sp.]|uniref:XrtA/PEP-CTERM system histidine kinase PrsK n=1 Tax=Sphingorhabdus sp. TaxID=1902408 RepID=UPI00391D6983